MSKNQRTDSLVHDQHLLKSIIKADQKFSFIAFQSGHFRWRTWNRPEIRFIVKVRAETGGACAEVEQVGSALRWVRTRTHGRLLKVKPSRCCRPSLMIDPCRETGGNVRILVEMSPPRWSQLNSKLLFDHAFIFTWNARDAQCDWSGFKVGSFTWWQF